MGVSSVLTIDTVQLGYSDVGLERWMLDVSEKNERTNVKIQNTDDDGLVDECQTVMGLRGPRSSAFKIVTQIEDPQTRADECLPQ